MCFKRKFPNFQSANVCTFHWVYILLTFEAGYGDSEYSFKFGFMVRWPGHQDSQIS
jgi:hypothetical protein